MSATPQHPSNNTEPTILWSLGKCLLALVLLAWTAHFAVGRWIAYKVPLPAELMKEVTWLAGATNFHFVGFVLSGMAIVMLLVALLSGTWVPFKVATVVCIPLIYAASPEQAVRIGIYEGTHKIGCFVPDTLECHRTLGLSGNPPELRVYAPAGNTDPQGWTPEYRAARAKLVSPELEKLAVSRSIPLLAYLRTPFYLGKTDEMNAAIEKQALDVARLRKDSAFKAAKQ